MKAEEQCGAYVALTHPNALPNGWTWATMADIAEVVGGGTPRTSDPGNFEDGDIPWLTPADLSGYTEKYISHGARFITRKGLDTSSARILPTDSVLFTSRAPIGYVVIARNPIATNQGFKSFVLKGGVLPEYVYWWLKGAKHIAESLASGTTFLELSGVNARKIPIPIAPFDQQKHIVAEIEKQFSRLDEAVANLKRVKANLKRYKAAVLKAAVEGRLVKTEAELARREGRSFETGAQLLERILETRRSQWKGKGKYKESAAPDTTDLPELPEGWVWTSVEQLGAIGEQAVLTGPFGSNIGRSDFQDTGVPILTIGCLQEGGLSIEKAVFVSEGKAGDLARYKLNQGDILFSRMASVGRAGFVTTPFEGALFNYHIMRLRLEKNAIEPMSFIYYVRGSKVVRDYVREVNHGATRDGINTEQLLNLPVTLPPTAEQHRIVAEVDRLLSLVREVESQVDANLQRAERLRQSILSRAFSGELVKPAATQAVSPTA